MRDEYDFSKAVRKNPFAKKMKNGYSVTVNYAPADSGSEKKYGTSDDEKPIDTAIVHGLSSAVSE